MKINLRPDQLDALLTILAFTIQAIDQQDEKTEDYKQAAARLTELYDHLRGTSNDALN